MQGLEEDQFSDYPTFCAAAALPVGVCPLVCALLEWCPHSQQSKFASSKAPLFGSMPLLKRKPYDLSKPPNNLKAKDLVFQVRSTKEIFKDYEEYLKHVNLYRQRVWTCKYSGKSNLTYEEALESERKTTEKVQQFPREFMGPVLQLVQYSMLRIEDLVSAILKAFRDRFVPGEDVVCVKENVTRPCKVLREIEVEGPENKIFNYEVELLDNDKNVIGISFESTGSLVRKKPPFTRALVKSFIRESVKDNASRNSQTPLVVLDKLCHKYGITTSPPEELKKFFVKQEQNEKGEDEVMLQPLIEATEPETHANKKRKKVDTELECQTNKKQKKVDREPENHGNKKQKLEDTDRENQVKKKQKKSEGGEGGAVLSEDDKSKTKTEPIVKVVPIKYPIEDTLVQLSPLDPPLQERPILSSDFTLPMGCTGPLLMIWNFCSLFGKVIRLSPFSLEAFEKALECNDTDPILLREVHHALIKLILSDTAINESFQEKRKRKVKVTIQSWKDDLSDLLELDGFEKLAIHSSTIGKGNYKLLEPFVKLEILSQLADCALGSTAIREQLDVYIEEKQAIASQKRKEDLEKSKQAQELIKQAQIASTTPDMAGETVASEPPKDEQEGEDEDDEGSDSDGGTDNDVLSTDKKVHSNGLPNGAHENGDSEEATALAAGCSRQLALKLKAEQKQAEDLEKEKKRIEELKKLQEIRKVKFEAVKERKLQEKKMLELQKRQEHLEREIEKRVIRTHPLGKDRDHNKYWFFAREGRIFVEDRDLSKWGYYSAKEELEALYGSLNPKGIRERALQRQLEKHYNKISDALQRRSKDIAQRVALEDSSVRRSSRGKTAPQQTVENIYRNKYRSS